MNGCQAVFEEYRACVQVPIPSTRHELIFIGQTQLKKRGLDKLLEEAKADESGFDDSPLMSGVRRK